MNRELLSLKLKEAFAGYASETRPLPTLDQEIEDPFWIAGFASGEGCFYISITKESGYNKVRLRFQISQHSRDLNLLRRIENYLGCGKCFSKKEVSLYMVGSFKDIDSKIIPFFKKHSILGVKSLDFEAFCEAAEIVKSKRHLTTEGLAKLTQIKNTMNKQRYNSSSPQGMNGKRFFSTTTRNRSSRLILNNPTSPQEDYFLKID